MTFKQWVLELFKDERGSISIKPVVSFLGSIFALLSLKFEGVFETEIYFFTCLDTCVCSADGP